MDRSDPTQGRWDLGCHPPATETCPMALGQGWVRATATPLPLRPPAVSPVPLRSCPGVRRPPSDQPSPPQQPRLSPLVCCVRLHIQSMSFGLRLFSFGLSLFRCHRRRRRRQLKDVRLRGRGRVRRRGDRLWRRQLHRVWRGRSFWRGRHWRGRHFWRGRGLRLGLVRGRRGRLWRRLQLVGRRQRWWRWRGC